MHTGARRGACQNVVRSPSYSRLLSGFRCPQDTVRVLSLARPTSPASVPTPPTLSPSVRFLTCAPLLERTSVLEGLPRRCFPG